MNRNQKIALGCGGAGCFGLIVLVIAACLIYFFYYRRTPPTNADYDYNANSNRGTNLNSSDDDNSNANTNSTSSTSTSTSTSASSLSNDEKHRLFQAASMTADAELVRRVSVKIGLMSEDYTPGDDYQEFVSEHVDWGLRNTEFIQSIATQEKARAYVNEHFPD